MNKQNDIISGLISIVLGILFIVFKAEILKWMVIALGVILIVLGAIDLVAKNIVWGVVKIAVGVLMIVFASTVLFIALYIIGVLLIIFGILLLVNFINNRRKYPTLFVRVIAVMVAVLYILVGTCLCFNQAEFINTLYIVMGVLLIVQGGLSIISGAVSKK